MNLITEANKWMFENTSEKEGFFHRTKPETLELILKSGKFKINKKGSTKYGWGVYGTPSLKTQFSKLQDEDNYGECIIYAEPHLNDTLFIYKSQETIRKQLQNKFDFTNKKYEAFMIASTKKFKDFDQIGQWVGKGQKDNEREFNSYFDSMYISYKNEQIIVVYNPELLDIKEYSYDEGKTWYTYER